MSIDLITELGPGLGERVVPDFGSDAIVSAEWIEVEHRGPKLACGVTVGFWEGQAGALRLDPWLDDELCVLLTGRVALIDDAGRRREFVAGQSFVIPQEFAGVWETVTPSTKVFVAFPERDRA